MHDSNMLCARQKVFYLNKALAGGKGFSITVEAVFVERPEEIVKIVCESNAQRDVKIVTAIGSSG